MRISIIGHSSSGKSTLAKKISEKLGIPHLHIDRLWFESGAYRMLHPKNADKLEKAREWIKGEVAKWIQQKDWVSDGWYSKVQPMVTGAADVLIYIDIPLWKRMMNHLKRTFTDERHKELNIWDDLRFVFEMPYRTLSRYKKIRQFIKDNEAKLVVLRSHKETDRYLENL